MLYFLVLGGAFLTTLLMVMGLYNLVYGARGAVLQRLEAHTAEIPSTSLQLPDAPRSKGLRGDLLNFMGTLGSILPQRSNRMLLQQKLNQAHILMRAEEFIGLSFLVGMLFFLLVFLALNNILLALVVGVVSYKIPGVLVGLKKKRRMETLTNQLPEALSVISSGLRAGYSFSQAMSVVSREMEAPIKEEFSRVIWENRMGKTLEGALHNLEERTESDDLDLFITAVLIQKQVGGNLAEILDNISHTIRERVRIKGEIKTLTAQGKLSAVIVVLLPLALAAFLYLFNPEYIMLLFQHILGQIMLVLAVILQVIGIIIIQKVINIDV